jgi:hypothetical protein
VNPDLEYLRGLQARLVLKIGKIGVEIDKTTSIVERTALVRSKYELQKLEMELTAYLRGKGVL